MLEIMFVYFILNIDDIIMIKIMFASQPNGMRKELIFDNEQEERNSLDTLMMYSLQGVGCYSSWFMFDFPF